MKRGFCLGCLAPGLRKTFRAWPQLAADGRYNLPFHPGQVPERLNGPVSKTGMGFLVHREFESHPVRFLVGKSRLDKSLRAAEPSSPLRGGAANRCHQMPPKE